MASNRDLAWFVGRISKDLTENDYHGIPLLRRQLRTVLRQAGKKRRAPAWLADLEHALKGANKDRPIYCSPLLSDPTLRLRDWVHFSTDRLNPISAVRESEKVLTNRLMSNPNWIAGAIPAYGGVSLADHTEVGRFEYRLDGKRYRPDLVLETSRRGLVVCEIEAGKPKRESIPQLDDYVRVATRKLKKKVSALLITYPTMTSMERDLTWRRLTWIEARGRPEWLWFTESGGLTSAHRPNKHQ